MDKLNDKLDVMIEKMTKIFDEIHHKDVKDKN